MAQTATDTAAAGRGDAWPYYVDALQRGVLFLDVLRERGDNILAHERAGQPPLLDFEHELVIGQRPRVVLQVLRRSTGLRSRRIAMFGQPKVNKHDVNMTRM